MRLRLAVQRRLQSLAHQPLPNPGDGIEMHREHLGNPRVRPVRPLRIGLQQDLRVANFRRQSLAFARQRR